MSPRALLPAPVRTKHTRKYPLDQKLVRLSRRDYFRLRDFVRSFEIKGSVGAGKSSGPFELLMQSAWHPAADHCGLVLCAKPDAAQKAVQILQSCGKDYVVIKPGSGHRLNLITYAMENAGVSIPMDNAFQDLWTMLDILNRDDTARQGDNFFVPAQKELIFKAMRIVYAATGTIDIRDVLSICNDLPGEKTRHCFVWGLIEKIRRKISGKPDEQLFQSIRYFEKTLPDLNDKTRSSIAISATVRLAPLMEEPLYSMFFSGSSTLTPRNIIDRNLVAVIDVPYSTYHNAARAVGAAWKQAMQKTCLQRTGEDTDVPCGIWADECAVFLTDFDIEAVERGRSARMYHALTGQSSASWVNGYGGGPQGESKARTLEASIANKIMCAQTDHETRRRSQEMIGQTLQWVKQVGFSERAKDGDEFEMCSWARSENYSTQYQPAFPEEWLLGLETGQRGFVEAYVFRGGDKFNWNGKRYLLVRWHQNHPGWRWDGIWEKHPTARPWADCMEWRDFLRRDAFYRAANFWSDGQAFPGKPTGGERRHV